MSVVYKYSTEVQVARGDVSSTLVKNISTGGQGEVSCTIV